MWQPFHEKSSKRRPVWEETRESRWFPLEGRFTLSSPRGEAPVPGQAEGGTADTTVLRRDTEPGGVILHNSVLDPCSRYLDLAPPCGEKSYCRPVDMVTLHSIDMQTLFLISRVNDLRNRIVRSRYNFSAREDFAAQVATFMSTCQPYFNFLESRGRSIVSQRSKMRRELLCFSQLLCDNFEGLLMTCASYNILSLDETEPHSMSPFCIGQCQLGSVRLTTFRYAHPMPYLSQVDTCWYKRMRWNVEICGGHSRDGQAEGTEEENVRTEYYFLCYEEATEAEQVQRHRTWSIGQWVQVQPNVEREDIYDWILCRVPQARFEQLVILGHVEPPACRATDFLLELLFA